MSDFFGDPRKPGPRVLLFRVAQDAAGPLALLHMENGSSFRVTWPAENYQAGGSWFVHFATAAPGSLVSTWLHCGFLAIARDRFHMPAIYPTRAVLRELAGGPAVYVYGADRPRANGLALVLVNECRPFLFNVAEVGLMIQVDDQGPHFFEPIPGIPRI